MPKVDFIGIKVLNTNAFSSTHIHLGKMSFRIDKRLASIPQLLAYEFIVR